jgi:hypothetical protein
MPSIITAVAITEFEFTVNDIGLEQAAAGVGNMAYVKGNRFPARRFAVRISTTDGVHGEYVAHWVGTPSTLAQTRMLAPLIVSEHIRGLEQKASFLLNGGCDMIHADPEYDMGITGVMKIAHFCEALGLDLQIHACGPAHRACNSAIRNTHMYEMALMCPGMPNMVPPVYTCGYSDQPEDLGKDGCVPVPDGPGLGVTYDWDFIEEHKTQDITFD